jgi:hypothetical protein
MLLAEKRINDAVKDWESELLTSLMQDAVAGLAGQSTNIDLVCSV